MEAVDAAEKLQTTLRVIAAFLACMGEYRSRSIRAAPGNPWRFSGSAVCGHLDIFRQRLLDMLAVASAALQYARLERVEVGGSMVGLRVLASPLQRPRQACTRQRLAPFAHAGQGADPEAARASRGGAGGARARAAAAVRPLRHGRDRVCGRLCGLGRQHAGAGAAPGRHRRAGPPGAMRCEARVSGAGNKGTSLPPCRRMMTARR